MNTQCCAIGLKTMLSFFMSVYEQEFHSFTISLCICRFTYDPSVQVPPKEYPKAEVAGTNRYKYFRRPIIPFLPQMPPNVVLAPTRYTTF